MARTASATLGWFLMFTVPVSCQRPAEAQPDAPARLLVVGTPLPVLEGVDQNGTVRRLAESKGRPVVVYFYPKDNTPGCTKQACAFRDVWQRFEQAGVIVYGVSRDDRASHERFARAHRLPFPLIADTDGRWANTFGVPDLGGKSGRVTFLFDSQGKLTRVYPNVDPGAHATQVLNDVAKVRG